MPALTDSVGPNATTRQIYETHEENPSCATCHKLMDPIGFAFEHFDASGAWRDSEKDQPIDSTGMLSMISPPQSFDGAVSLSRVLAEAPEVRACVTKQFLRLALGREILPADDAELAAAAKPLVNGDSPLIESLIALVSTPQFGQRLAADGEILP